MPDDVKPEKPWVVRDVSEQTRRKVKAYAGEKGVTMAQAIEQLVDMAESENGDNLKALVPGVPKQTWAALHWYAVRWNITDAQALEQMVDMIFRHVPVAPATEELITLDDPSEDLRRRREVMQTFWRSLMESLAPLSPDQVEVIRRVKVMLSADVNDIHFENLAKTFEKARQSLSNAALE